MVKPFFWVTNASVLIHDESGIFITDAKFSIVLGAFAAKIVVGTNSFSGKVQGLAAGDSGGTGSGLVEAVAFFLVTVATFTALPFIFSWKETVSAIWRLLTRTSVLAVFNAVLSARLLNARETGKASLALTRVLRPENQQLWIVTGAAVVKKCDEIVICIANARLIRALRVLAPRPPVRAVGVSVVVGIGAGETLHTGVETAREEALFKVADAPVAVSRLYACPVLSVICLAACRGVFSCTYFYLILLALFLPTAWTMVYVSCLTDAPCITWIRLTC